VLNIIVPIAHQFGLEAGGNIEGFRNRSGASTRYRYRYTIPSVGEATAVGVPTHAIGYHTHPSGSLLFSNRRNSSGGIRENDTEWVRNSGKSLYVGALSADGTVGIAVCECTYAPTPAHQFGTPGRVVQ
jgi:hypothetical protein